MEPQYRTVRIEQFVSTSADIRDCIKLGPSRGYSGVWSDFAYAGNHFSADDPRGLPGDLGLSVDPYKRSAIYSLAGISGPIDQIPGHRYRLTFTGQLARLGPGWLDTPSNLIVVTKVARAELLPDIAPHETLSPRQ